jgi:hypothetical protein
MEFNKYHASNTSNLPIHIIICIINYYFYIEYVWGLCNNYIIIICAPLSHA